MKNKLKKAIIFGLFCTFFFSSVHAADYLTITTDNANIKTGPGKNHPTSMELFQGYPLKVLSKEGEWYKVSDFEEDTGWVHQSIVKKCDTVIVSSENSINMRSEPSTNGSILADVERGVVMTRLGTKENWTQVRHSSGTTGWIFSPLLWP
ncbi:MAG: SH3 domain-containing protein [Proteobacteria bacterium]|nr:SH3 domain-containing protein [Pseudomonadota bacterium]